MLAGHDALIKASFMTCASMHSSLLDLQRPAFKALRLSGSKPCCYRAVRQPIFSMAAFKRVLVPVGTGSEEMEAVRCQCVVEYDMLAPCMHILFATLQFCEPQQRLWDHCR